MDIKRELDEDKIKQEFREFHTAYAQIPYICNLTKFAKEMGISRIKIYRWLNNKTHLTQTQLIYIKNVLTRTVFGFIITTMIQSCLYYINYVGDKSRLIVKFFKEGFDKKSNSFFVFVTYIKKNYSLKLNYHSWAFLFVR